MNLWDSESPMCVRMGITPVLPAIATIVGVGYLLCHFLERPKAIFIIFLAMIVWSLGGWFVGGWRPVLAGLAALTTALSASNGDYVLAAALSVLLLVFLSTHIRIVPPRQRP
jgi:hypothetical protein